jgi:predicted nucleic acid-binding protein
MATRKQAKQSVRRSGRVSGKAEVAIVTAADEVPALVGVRDPRSPLPKRVPDGISPAAAPSARVRPVKSKAKRVAKAELKHPAGFLPRRPVIAPKVQTPRQSSGRARPAGAQSKSLLPKRIMLDANVIIMALEYDNPRLRSDPKVKDARELWERALAECTVLLPPFIVLELLLGGVSTPLPALRNLMHVAFTYEVAESMGSWASMPAPGPKLRRAMKVESGADARNGRYDALIVGTAKFYGADVLVTQDVATKAIAKAAGVVTQAPAELLRWTQRGLPGI